MIAPSKDNIAPAQKLRLGRSWIVALGILAVVGIAVVAIVLLRGNKDATLSGAESRKPAKVSPVKPSIAPTKPKTDTPTVRPDAPLPPQKPHEVRDGMLMLSNGQLLPTNKLRKVSIADRQPRFKYAVFDHPTDNELAAILTLRPGQALIGGPIRHKDYKADFLKSLETPVIVRKDDPEDVQEVKRAVIEARMLIKEAIDNGEDPADVVKNAYQEAQKLALYKDDLRRQVLSMAKKGDYTEAEIDDLVAAANKMLEAKGIEPMKLGPIMKTRLKVLKQ